MAQGSGVSVIASLVQSSVWWTAEPANVANKGIHIESDTLPIGSPELVPDTSLGSPWEKGNDLGNTIVDGAIAIKSRYDSLNTLWGLTVGAAAAASSLGNGAFAHVFTLTADLAGKFATYCVFDGVAVREATSAKFTGFELSGTGGQALDLSFPMMCDDRIVTSTVNTTLAAVTYLPYDGRVMFDDVLIRINAQGGAALTDSDTFYFSDFRITLDRPHEAPFVTNRRNTRSEPIANGKPTIRIALTEDAYTSTSRIAALRTRTAFKMDFEALASVAIGTSTYNYRLYMEFPGVFHSAVRLPINGPSRIIPDLEFVAEQVAAAPTGMTGLTLPMRMTVWNASASNALA